jgi:hypothetical protein
MTDTDVSIGKLIATQEALSEQIGKLELSVATLRGQQEKLFRKLSMGKGFVVGLTVASGGIGAIITTVISKLTGA